MQEHLLSIILFTPLVGVLVLMFLPRSQKTLVRLWANISAAAGLLVSIPLIVNFNRNADGMQFVERKELSL